MKYTQKMCDFSAILTAELKLSPSWSICPKYVILVLFLRRSLSTNEVLHLGVRESVKEATVVMI